MSGNYRPTERTTGTITWSASAPSGDVGNATHALDGALWAVLECIVATSSPAGTVEGKTASGVWTQIESYQLTSGTYTRRAAGATVTLATSDMLYMPGAGFTHVRFKRASGTSMECTLRTLESLTDNLLAKMLAAGLSIDGPIADDAAFSVATTKVFPFGALADETSPDSVDEGDIGAVRMTLDRLLKTQDTPPTVNNHFFIADATDENLISNTARKVYGVQIFHIDATPVYVKLYDKATAPDQNDTPVWAIGVPANATSTLGAGSNVVFQKPITLANGLGVRAVTGIANNDDNPLTASEVMINIQWGT